MGGKIVYRQVLDVLKERANIETTVTEISHVTGFKTDSINQGIRTLRGHGSIIEAVKPGYSYIYRGEHANRAQTNSDKRMFEEIGVLKTGAIIIQDEDGNLYRAEEIK